MTNSQATCAPLWGLLWFFYLVTSALILLKKKTELAALENSYVSCQMSFVKVTWKVPSVNNFPTNKDKWSLPWCKFKFCIAVFCSTLQRHYITVRFLFQLFFKSKEMYDMSSTDPLCLFCLVFIVYQLTHPIFGFFCLSSPSSTWCQKQKRLSLL